MEDGAHTIFLSTKGTNRDEVSPELVEFLDYVGKPTEDAKDSDDEFVRKLKETVKKVKADREMGAKYMTLEDLLKDERKEGRMEGRAEGQILKLVELIKKKLEKNQSVEQIAEDLVESVDTIQRLMEEYVKL